MNTCKLSEKIRRKRKDYAFQRQLNEKLSMIPGCPTQKGLLFTCPMNKSLLQHYMSHTKRCCSGSHMLIASLPSRLTASLSSIEDCTGLPSISASKYYAADVEFAHYISLYVAAAALTQRETLTGVLSLQKHHCLGAH